MSQLREIGPNPAPASLVTQLQRLLEWHEQAAANIRGVLALLDYPADIVRDATVGSAGEPQEATADDREPESAQARRRRTARLLASYSTTVPGPRVPEAGVLMRHGYLKRKRDGWVRTGKAFVV